MYAVFYLETALKFSDVAIFISYWFCNYFFCLTFVLDFVFVMVLAYHIEFLKTNCLSQNLTLFKTKFKHS